jgi:hypothetical protein
LPALTGRLRAALIALTAATLAVAMLAPATSAAAPEPPGLDAFMKAMGQVESSGRYTAVNPVSGAYGKYQIMPRNWPVWAQRYLGDASASQSPENQEAVARGRFIALYRQLNSWPRVAYWWLTGSTKPVDQWSAKARRYVDKVMALAGGKGWTMAVTAPGAAGTVSGKGTTRGPAPKAAAPAPPPPPIHLDNDDPAIAYKGAWSTASHAGYVGGSVAWSTSRGASASVTFTGRSISWTGPAGPTRGAVQVYIDGVLVANVNQFASGFTAQRTLYTRDFGTSGPHTLRIVVTGTSGHPMVAFDQLVVGF